MYTGPLIPLCILTFFNVQLSLAVKFPFHVRHSITDGAYRLRRRAEISGQTTGDTPIPVANSQNARYISNITLGGQTVPVMLDTGSSDLWVSNNIPGAKNTGKAVTLSYAVGQAKGDIHLAPLTFDNYTINDQAFLMVTDTSTFTTDMRSQQYQGLVGLGPNSGSVIRKKLDNGAAGDTMMDRIFQQNRTSANFLSFLLDRRGDPKDPFTGQLTISELVPGFEKITSTPKMPVQQVLRVTNADQHWQILTDKDKGIIGPDGFAIEVKSIVQKAPSGTIVAVIDSGFTFPQVPRPVSDAIYGRVRGAVYNTAEEIWTVPCDQLINISFNLGGKNFPIHPLDTVSSDFNITGANGNPMCIGTFQPITSAFSLLGEFDIILGMAFLRNTYTLLDFGNFVDATSNDRGDPYVQLLSITNVEDAHKDFVQTRLNGVDTTGDPSKALLPVEQMQHSPESPGEKQTHLQGMVLRRWPYIVAGCLAFLAIVMCCAIWRCCCGRQAKGGKTGKKAAPLIPMSGGLAKPAYYPLREQYSPSSNGHGGGHHGGSRR